MSTRRKFTDNFKQKVVQEAQASDKSMAAVAKKHNISPGLLYNWCKKSEHLEIVTDQFENQVSSSDEMMFRETIERLQRENELLRFLAADRLEGIKELL